MLGDVAENDRTDILQPRENLAALAAPLKTLLVMLAILILTI
jgi:hypothetical protein